MANNQNGDNGWNEWKRHILIQLDKISEFIESSIEERSKNTQRINDITHHTESKIQDFKNDINKDINEIKSELAQIVNLINNKEGVIEDILIWKKLNDDNSIIKTVTELNNWYKERENLLKNSDIEKLNTKIEDTEKFKIRIITIYLVIQVIVFIILGLLKSAKV